MTGRHLQRKYFLKEKMKNNLAKITLIAAGCVILGLSCKGKPKANPQGTDPTPTNAGVTGEKKNSPPTISHVSLSPQDPKLKDALKCDVGATDVDHQDLQIQYKWFINGNGLDNEVQSTLAPGHHVRGDSIYCQAVAYDGFSESRTEKSNAVKVVNTPPEIMSIKEVPEKPGKNTGLEFQVESKDEDGDRLTTEYTWFHDGKPMPEQTTSKILGAELKKETFYWVFVKVSDGQDSVSQHSLKIPISNSPPVITTTPPNFVKDMQEYRYKVEASDLDGDPIKFLVSGAGGGQISDSGEFSWKPTPNQSGKNTIRITAQDSDGAQAYQEFELYVAFEKKNLPN